MPHTGGQVRLAARNPRRRDLLGIVDWRDAQLARLGVEVRCDTVADAGLISEEEPDVVVIATGGLPAAPLLSAGVELTASTWDVLSGELTPTGDVLLYDDTGDHSALSAAELIARSGARLEIVTPERVLGVEVGGLNHVPYARALNEADVRITLNQRLLSVHRESGRLRATIGSDHSPHVTTRIVDHVVTDQGTAVNADLYFALKPRSVNLGAVDHHALLDGRAQNLVRNEGGAFRLFRIGDAVAGRNIHAAVYDALRYMKDV